MTNPLQIPDAALQAAKRKYTDLAFKYNWQGSCPDDDAMREIITAAIRALPTEPVQGEQWQPIETAPKDGSEVLVWSEAYNGQWTPARWDEDKYAKKPSPRWISDGRAYERRTLITFPPTHWMPLPAALSSEAVA